MSNNGTQLTNLVRMGYLMVSFRGTTGLLKFYHSGRTYIIPSTTGTQQGDSLWGILFTAPLQQLFNQIADKLSEILIRIFADKTVFLAGSNSSRYVQYAPCPSKSSPQFCRFNLSSFKYPSILPAISTPFFNHNDN